FQANDGIRDATVTGVQTCALPISKGAVFDHDNLAAMARGAGALSAFGDRRLSPLPFAHVAYMTRVWDELERAITTVITPTPWNRSEERRVGREWSWQCRWDRGSTL